MTKRRSATERTAAWALLASATFAALNLPTAQLPPAWLLAFALPAALIGRATWLQRLPWLLAVVALALQVAACWVAYTWAGPLSQQAALACTLLPPLAFVTIRRRDADAPLGQFLAFCVTTIGVLFGGPQPHWLAAYAFAACLSLRSESCLATLELARHRTADARSPGASRLFGTTLTLVIGCALVGVLLVRGLVLLPSPSDRDERRATGGRPAAPVVAQGLDDSFVLDGGGILADLHGEQLVRVASEDGQPVQQDLYLRTGFFVMPDLDRWTIGPLDLEPVDTVGGHRLHRPIPGAAVRWLTVERYAGASNFVPMPPGTCEVRELDAGLLDATREFLAQRPDAENDVYRIAYQDLPPPPDDLTVDPRGERLGLLGLPRNFDGQPFATLLARWRIRGAALQVAAKVAEGLGRHCRYERLDPVGPYPHALQNFLFAEGDRYGYCMHFASAAALLLRMCGVPCRIAVGLYGGGIDPRDPAARIYGSQHAHAWVEIPFPGRGYTVFDPTPAAERGASTPPRDPQGTATAVDESGDDLRAALLAFAEFLLQPWLLATAAALAALRLLHLRRGSTAHRDPATPALRAPRRLLGRLLAELARAGLHRQRRQTLESFARELAARGCLVPEVGAAFAAYQEVRFGGRPFDAGRASRLEDGIAAARLLASRAAPAPLTS